ncbi:type VI secretion system tube protein TssD [Sediminicola luteus]|uniref:Type VI secretion system tube protein TssD n=1 Tax=Sediminicola luteus TaxID=319238 RepID=A0ABV2TYH5_9FLAO
MVLSAKLHIQGHQNEEDGIQLLSCDYNFSQEIDQKGLPTSKVNGGIINLSFPSLEDNEIIQWMISEDADKSGEISFSGDTNSKPFRTLEFKDARLVFYQENFMDQSNMVTTLSISTRELTISGVKYTNAWMGY